MSTFLCVSNNSTIFSIVEGGYKQSSSGKAIRELLASVAPNPNPTKAITMNNFA